MKPETTQHYKLEWSAESGVQEVVARVYNGKGRTSAYVPIPYGEWDGNTTLETWAKAQEMYQKEYAKAF